MAVKTKHQIVRVSGKLKQITTVHDESGDVLHRVMAPFMAEFYAHDMMQVVVGAALLAIPVGFTEETWNLGQTLPMMNVLGLFVVSLLFLAAFAYLAYYRGHFKDHWGEFIKRVLFTYFFAFIVVAILLTLIQRAPWQADLLLAIKRTILVAFPASMSAAVADTIK